MTDRLTHSWPALCGASILALEFVIRVVIFNGHSQWFNVSSAFCLWSVGVQLPVLLHLHSDIALRANALKYGMWFFISLLCWFYTLFMSEHGIGLLSEGGASWTNACVIIAVTNFFPAGLAAGFSLLSLKEVW